MKSKYLTTFLLSIIGLMIMGGCSNTINSCDKNNTSPSSNISNTISNNKVSSTTISNSTTSSSNEIKNDVVNISINYNSEIIYEYSLGETLNLDNVTIHVEYEDKTNEDIQVTNDMITLINHENKETNLNTAGYAMVVISYKGHTTSYMIEIINPNAPFDKIDPLIIFNYTEGYTFYIGTDEKPSVSILPEDINYTVTYSSDESGYNSSEFPSVSGTYSLVVTVANNEKYNDVIVWRWFILAGEKETPTVTFGYSPGTTFYLDSDVRPTVTVSDGADYIVTYSSDTTGYNSTEFPSVAGTYSLVVTVKENEHYSYLKVWRWFKLVEPSPTN